MKELERVVPNSEVFLRRNSTIKKMVTQSTEKGYTDIIVINEHQKEPGTLYIIN
jgi:rRNA maturation protein Rpf1